MKFKKVQTLTCENKKMYSKICVALTKDDIIYYDPRF